MDILTDLLKIKSIPQEKMLALLKLVNAGKRIKIEEKPKEVERPKIRGTWVYLKAAQEIEIRTGKGSIKVEQTLSMIIDEAFIPASTEDQALFLKRYPDKARIIVQRGKLRERIYETLRKRHARGETFIVGLKAFRKKGYRVMRHQFFSLAPKSRLMPL